MNHEKKGWISRHAEIATIMSTLFAIICGIIISITWMNSGFNRINDDIATIEKDIAVIKTVLIMKNIMPQDAALVVIDEMKK